MDSKVEWTILAEWREMNGIIDVSLTADNLDALISGTIRRYDDEAIYVALGDRPASICDDQAMRVVLAIYQYLTLNVEHIKDVAAESIDLLPWLRQEVGERIATPIYAGLSFHYAKQSAGPFPSLGSGAGPRLWRFRARWLDEPGAEWRLVQTELAWRQGEGGGSLAAIVKADRRGDAVVKEVTNDDLLLPLGDMEWLMRQLLKRHWLHLQAYGYVDLDIGDVPVWLGASRGRTGTWVAALMESAIRTFGSSHSQP